MYLPDRMVPATAPPPARFFGVEGCKWSAHFDMWGAYSTAMTQVLG